MIRWDLIGVALTLLTWLLGPKMPEPLRITLYALSVGTIGYGIAPAVLAGTKARRRKMWPVILLCVATFAGGFAIYWMIKEGTSAPEVKSGREVLPILAVECSLAPLPTTMPSDGNLAFIDFFYEPSWGDAGPVGFAGRTGQPGEKLDWYLDRTLGQTMRCTITNQEAYTLFSINFSLKVQFKESISSNDGRSTRSGEMIKERDWPLGISKIDAGKSFTFYALTQGKYYVYAALPQVATYFDPNTNRRKEVRLLLLSWNALTVTPATLNGRNSSH